ncbi:MAG: exodeoxyribonuclease III [Spirochaetales bacterium]
MIRVYSWNVNGLRAVEKKGFLNWLQACEADIVCIQETKIQEDQLSEEIKKPNGYCSYWACAERKGYSGVGLYSRIEPLSISTLGDSRFDSEGRTLVVEYPGFVLINAYFPNSQEEGARLSYKLDFCEALRHYALNLVALGKQVLISGDYNIAHKPIDLANPKANEKNPGYLPEEREWMDKFIGSGFVDTFRMFNQEPGQYTWWTYRFKAREKNIGWRIDYHCVNAAFAPYVQNAAILKEVMGSDHCPVAVTLDI